MRNLSVPRLAKLQAKLCNTYDSIELNSKDHSANKDKSIQNETALKGYRKVSHSSTQTVEALTIQHESD